MQSLSTAAGFFYQTHISFRSKTVINLTVGVLSLISLVFFNFRVISVDTDYRTIIHDDDSVDNPKSSLLA